MSLAGKIAYHVWHRPLATFQESLAAGGPVEQWRTTCGHRAMRAAARSLPIPANSDLGQPLPPLCVHLLTGCRFWDQTAFCLWTFAHHSNRVLAPVLYDDGTLDEKSRAPLLRLFPFTRFVSPAGSAETLARHLPPEKFPALNDRWLRYPNIRKLIDPHLGSNGWKLVIDSDLLFFRRPNFLLDWLDAPTRPLHAVDCETSYGYSRPLMDELVGKPVADLVNVGLTGLCSEQIDWERLEYWCRRLIDQERTHYYLEQALVAMMVAGQDCAIAPRADYVTLPNEAEALACQAVMHHYVAHSKRWYFRRNWKRAITLDRNVR